MVVATAVTVADNGLAFTAVAERAGPFWSGRALGIQNTAQFLGASLVPPLVGLGVSASSYPAAFAAAAIFPLLAAPLVPVREERDLDLSVPARAHSARAPKPPQKGCDSLDARSYRGSW